MIKANQNQIEDIKKILLSDDFTLINIAGELNRFNNCLPELAYHDSNYVETFGKIYILDANNKLVNYEYIENMCKKKIDDIILAMSQYYICINVNCSELEDYIIDNKLVG